MPRESIAMSNEELTDFIGAKPWVVVGTLDEDGSPWGDVAASLVEDGQLIFALPTGTRAAANIERDPRVVCMNDQYPTYYEIKGVTIHGHARRLDDPALAARLPSDPIERNAADRTAYAVPLDDVTSFDFTKIKAKV